MKFLNFVFLLPFLSKVDTQNIDEELIKFGLSYYRSRSFVLLDDNINLYNVKNLMISLNDMYLFSFMSLSNFEKSFKLHYPGAKAMVVVFNYGNDFIQILKKLSHTGSLTSYKWLLTTTKFNEEDFRSVEIPLMSEVMIAEGQPLVGYNLTEIYETEPGVKSCNFLGKWTNGVQKLNSSTDIFVRRKNLKGVRIKVVTSIKDPCSEISFTEGTGSVVTCLYKILWGILAEMLNVTTETITSPNLTLNTLPDTGAELTFRSALVSSADMETRSFLWPVFHSKLHVVGSYINQKFEWRTFILPFSKEMWLCVIICIVLFDLTLLFGEFVTTRGTYKDAIRNYWRNYSFGALYAFFYQSGSDAPNIISYRIIFLLMFIVPTVLLQGYSAVVTSYLTAPLRKMPFRNLEELSRRKDYQLGWHRSFASENFFNPNTADPLYEAIFKNNILNKKKLPTTEIEAVERICTTKFAYMTIKEVVRILKPKCSHFKIYFKIAFTSMELKKNSWYKSFLNRCERKVDFTAILYRIAIQFILKYVDPDKDLNIDEQKPILMENIILPFAILFLGVMCSTMLLLLEVSHFKRSRKNLHQRCIRRRRRGERNP